LTTARTVCLRAGRRLKEKARASSWSGREIVPGSTTTTIQGIRPFCFDGRILVRAQPNVNKFFPFKKYSFDILCYSNERWYFLSNGITVSPVAGMAENKAPAPTLADFRRCMKQRENKNLVHFLCYPALAIHYKVWHA
jgi:hypothetical protein